MLFIDTLLQQSWGTARICRTKGWKTFWKSPESFRSKIIRTKDVHYCSYYWEMKFKKKERQYNNADGSSVTVLGQGNCKEWRNTIYIGFTRRVKSLNCWQRKTIFSRVLSGNQQKSYMKFHLFHIFTFYTGQIKNATRKCLLSFWLQQDH